MDRMLVTMREYGGISAMSIGINKHGKKFRVWMWKKDKVSCHKDFDELMEAYKVFEKLAGWLTFGKYKDEQRADWLRTGTMV